MDDFEGRRGLPGSPKLGQVVAEDGTSWVEFRSTLTPNFARVWADIALCHVMIFGGYAGVLAADWYMGGARPLIVALPLSLFIGFWMHALCTFGHEAVHYNIASDRARNDLLAEYLIWPFFAETTRHYRVHHWQHHVHLGDHQDTEISYHNCMSPWFLTRLVTGSYLVELLFRYSGQKSPTAPTAKPDGALDSDPWRGHRWAVCRTALLHGCLIGIPLLLGLWIAAAAWGIAALLAYPMFNTLRQILEHRREDAPCDIDFTEVEHGAITYSFGNGFVSRYFGAAGFNRHLLHHWEPSVSYTNFDAMQTFLRGTPLRDRIDASRRSYLLALLHAMRVAVSG